jgi:hypothetical protein
LASRVSTILRGASLSATSGSVGPSIGAPERRETAGVGRAIEQTEKPQHRQRPLPVLAVALEPTHICVHSPEGVAALFLGVRLLKPYPAALADVAAIGVAQIAADQVEGQRVAPDVRGKLLALLPRPVHAQRLEQPRARLGG